MQNIQTYDGYFENGSFFAAGRAIRLPDKKRVVINIFNEPVKTKPDDYAQRMAWLKRLEELTALSADEEFVYIPRSKEMRPPLDFSD
jgi:hypothetical protein